MRVSFISEIKTKFRRWKLRPKGTEKQLQWDGRGKLNGLGSVGNSALICRGVDLVIIFRRFAGGAD